MKVAVILQGEPRFCEEFDLFLKNLTGYSTVDYFMYFWKNNESTASFIGSSGHQVVSPFWQNVDKEKALEKFKQLLPDNHRVIALELGDQSLVPIHEITENYAQETIQSNVWKMWYSQYQANQLRVKHEQENNFKYDMVIRSRPDVAIIGELNAAFMKEHFDKDSSLVLMPRNKRCGYGVMMCDLFGFSTSDNMTIYTDIYNQALDHHSKGIKFHPETMLAKHLIINNLHYGCSTFDIEFRHLGTWRDIETGETWAADSVPNWNNKIYLSKFGRWE
jgi:hypothetical protein